MTPHQQSQPYPYLLRPGDNTEEDEEPEPAGFAPMGKRSRRNAGDSHRTR